MIAVADASPLCYLVLIGEIDLLPKLFLHVAVPHAVITELLHEDAPEAVRTWASNPPGWIGVKENPLSATTGLEKLQGGEQAAILLLESMKADIVLLDEKAARRVAVDRGLRVTGLLGVFWAKPPFWDWLSSRPRSTNSGRRVSDPPRLC